MSKPFDPTRPVATFDGRKARIVATDAANTNFPIIALLTNGSGGEYPESFTTKGTQWTDEPSPSDLINVPVVNEQFANVYPTGVGSGFGSRREADALAAVRRIGVLKITQDEDGHVVSTDYTPL